MFDMKGVQIFVFEVFNCIRCVWLVSEGLVFVILDFCYVDNLEFVVFRLWNVLSGKFIRVLLDF